MSCMAHSKLPNGSCAALQILKKKYDMGYLVPTWLGKRWQPFYQELLDLAGITSEPRVPAQGMSGLLHKLP